MTASMARTHTHTQGERRRRRDRDSEVIHKESDESEEGNAHTPAAEQREWCQEGRAEATAWSFVNGNDGGSNWRFLSLWEHVEQSGGW